MMLSLLCPTRARPGWFQRLHESVQATASGHWEIVAVLDADDKSYDHLDLPNVTWVRAEPGTIFSELWNVAWRNARGDVFQLAADDMVHLTDGFDKAVYQAMPTDGIALLCGDDMTGYWDDHQVATLGFLSRRWCDTLGYFTPSGYWNGVPYFESDFCDRWQSDLAVMVSRFFRIPIQTQHLHFTRGQAPFDETYQRNRERYAATNPSAIYEETLPIRLQHAAKLAEAICH